MSGSPPRARYLDALFATAPSSSLVELRVLRSGSMTREFFAVHELDAVAAAIERRAPFADAFVGVLPRRRRGGCRSDLITHGDVVWADCDTDASVAALDRFSPPPSVVVASGTGSHCHAYWLLRERVQLTVIERMNRTLASALGADPACVDGPRILRPPSLNHKHDPPRPVRLVRCRADQRYALRDLENAVGPMFAMSGRSSSSPRPLRALPDATDDSLRALPPGIYIERLTGVAVPGNRKVRCPFHDDRTPSLHVYDDAERGWYCFGCERGGSIYDFAAHLWLSGRSPDVPLRGRRFIEVRDQLSSIFSR